MSERNLYRGLGNFEGSIDEEGKLYDERHWLVGRIEGDTVYDHCNNKQGTIDANGKLWDINHNYVGEAHGNNFIGPTYQSTGMVRGDSFGEGNGSEYGALMMLKKRNQHYSGNMPDNDYNFPNNDEANDDESVIEEEPDDYDDGMDDDWEDDDREDYRPRAASRRNGRRNGNGGGGYEFDDGGYLTGCLVTFVLVLVLGYLVYYVISNEVTMY